VTLLINPVTGCSYFLPGLQLPSQLPVMIYTAWWTDTH